MPKSYLEILTEWVNKNESKKRRKDTARVKFLALKNDVFEALEGGYKVKTIWRHLKSTGRYPFGYETFLKYVNECKNIEQKKVVKEQLKKSVVEEKKEKIEDYKTPNKEEGIKGFTFNPVPKEEDLF